MENFLLRSPLRARLAQQVHSIVMPVLRHVQCAKWALRRPLAQQSVQFALRAQLTQMLIQQPLAMCANRVRSLQVEQLHVCNAQLANMTMTPAQILSAKSAHQVCPA
jgi:hypothetical protein